MKIKKYIIFAILFCMVSLWMIDYNLSKTNKKLTEEKTEAVVKKINEDRYIFVSYIDYSKLLKNKKKEEKEKNIDEMVNNIHNANFNVLILQVRPFADSIYFSNYYPTSSTVVKNEGDELDLDILDYFIKKAHAFNMQLYAWVNPYRVRNVSDSSTISKDSTIYKWLNTDHLKIIDNKGIFFNPSSKEANELIINGIDELSKNYDIDGLLFDDYFYPNKEIDYKEYKEYVKNGGENTLEEYHLQVVNDLIYNVYKTIKSNNKKILFGISPDGNINNNYSTHYADVKKWCSSKDYIDFIMPQVYYGFLHDVVPFSDTIEEWNELITNDIVLIPALSLYKAGDKDTYAGSGYDEWVNNFDIIKRQIIYSRNLSKYQGFAIYRYDYYFNNLNYNDHVLKEINNMKSIL